jgi:hypothetical protein
VFRLVSRNKKAAEEASSALPPLPQARLPAPALRFHPSLKVNEDW